MARLSKAKQFPIYEDIPASDPTEECPPAQEHHSELKNGVESYELVFEDENGAQYEDIPKERDEDADDERRASAVTTASLSSLPESQYHTEQETSIPTHHSYAYPLMRPRFRRPSSVRRMQMTSPTRSPRQSFFSRSRIGTPRSVHSVSARSSPVSRKYNIEEFDTGQNDGPKHHPLILLHITLLPLDLPWSVDSMHEILPGELLEDIRLLQFKISETVLHRGILIPHPREEYDLLEERLLQALELKEERVTKCGHFKSRDSNSTTTSGTDSDSGVGSSIDGSDGELCATCKYHVKGVKSAAVGKGSKKWKIKVYAANGLMRSSAWVAAWAEMERIDVEISPWIADELRRALDERKAAEAVEEKVRYKIEDTRIREIVDEQLQLAQFNIRERSNNVAAPFESPRHPPVTDESEPRNTTSQKTSIKTSASEVCHPSRIPLSVLLKNYIYVLAQDRRNVAIFFLAILALYFAVSFPSVGKRVVLPSRDALSVSNQTTSSLPTGLSNGSEALGTKKVSVGNATVAEVPEIVANVPYYQFSEDEESAGMGEKIEEVREDAANVWTGEDVQATL